MTNLHTKISLLVLSSLLLVSVPTIILVVRGAESQQQEDLQNIGETLSRLLAASCLEPLLVEDYPVIETMIGEAAQSCRIVKRIRVKSANPRQSSLDDDSNASQGMVQYPTEFDETISDSLLTFRRTVSIGGSDDEDATVGSVEVALSTARHDAQLRSTTRQLLAGAAASFLALALIITYSIRKSVIRPLRKLSSHAERIGRGQLTDSIESSSKDEIGVLSRSMESMRSGLIASYERIAHQVRELKELDRLKDQFLANTSHEFKTPLNGIHGMADSLLQGDLGEPSDKWIGPVETIASCTTRLRSLTESILDFAKDRNTTATKSAPDQHRVKEHLSSSLVDLIANAERKGLHLRLNTPESLEHSYSTDEFETIIRILVDNSIKFTAQGLIEVIARPRDDGGLQVAVRDTGTGVSEEIRTQIFDPFVQGFRHDTRSYGGVGLGLSIASNTAAKEGWSLSCDSTTAQNGASFSLIIPNESNIESGSDVRLEPWPALVDVQELERRPQIEPSSTPRRESFRTPQKVTTELSSKRYRILVVDDEAINRKVLRLALQADFDVIEAKNGRECFDELSKQRIDLLLLDIMMPEISGYDVLREMNESGSIERVPVIVLSAKTAPEHIVRGLELGAADYLGKPFHREELRTRIQTQLRLKEQTERLEHEIDSKSKALQTAKEAVNVKSQFLANMSHEILTPLNGIYGFLNLAASEGMTEDPEQQLEFLNSAKECSSSLLSVVNDLLDVARIESNDMGILELSECSVAAVVSEVSASLLDAARNKGIELSVECDEAQDIVETDPSRLRDLVFNIVDNAIEFTDEGSVKIVAEILEDESPTISIRIQDTGSGIDPSRQESIFEPFVQADNSHTREHGGLGLGLSLSRQFARLLGGDLELVRSAENEGSEFLVSIPTKIVASAKAVALSV